jgi:hypothetical protein
MAALRSVLVGTVLAGALATGIAAAPAQAATVSTATVSTATVSTATVSTATAQANATKHWFSGFSGYGSHESRAKRSSYKGYWYYSKGRYYFDIKVWDRDRDNQSTYLDFYYHDNKGWHFGRQSFTDSQDEWAFSMSGDVGRVNGFRVRLGEGTPRNADWGSYYSRSF